MKTRIPRKQKKKEKKLIIKTLFGIYRLKKLIIKGFKPMTKEEHKALRCNAYKPVK